jgi:hypothetical protein
MLIKRSSTIKSSEITSEDNYLNRRKFIQSSTLIGGSLLSSRLLGANLPQEPFAELDDVKSSLYSTDEKIIIMNLALVKMTLIEMEKIFNHAHGQLKSQEKLRKLGYLI